MTVTESLLLICATATMSSFAEATRPVSEAEDRLDMETTRNVLVASAFTIIFAKVYVVCTMQSFL